MGVEYVGAVLPTIDSFEAPSWWAELDSDRPVVLVTQGTIANDDPGALLLPTIRALAGGDVLVIATTGNDATAEALRGDLPPNARVEAFLPYGRLLPKVDVMITNGGYGGVQFALAHGVPLIVAGDTEDKPEIAARVAWSGAGINLRTGRPSPEAIRGAVHRILDGTAYRSSAERLRDELAVRDPLTAIGTALENAVATAKSAATSEQEAAVGR
jgi:UDP:flavonoid glycosyltransferase YjiC (YdhE family)